MSFELKNKLTLSSTLTCRASKFQTFKRCGSQERSLLIDPPTTCPITRSNTILFFTTSGSFLPGRRTAFHALMDSIASDRRLLRHYTQNINCIEQSLPDLYERTVQLHGAINEALCQYCGWNGLRISESFSEACPRCQEVALDREKRGKRRSGIGRLRPNMVLYREEHPRGETIGATAEQDIREGLDAILVVGTALKAPGAKKLVRELCRAVKARDGLTIWVSNALPPAALRISSDLVIRGDCGEVALLLSC